MENWSGHETADLVYKDTTGALTHYLRRNCEGRFPHQILEIWDFASRPIEYHLEVKSTTRPRGTRFHLTGAQYKQVCILPDFLLPARRLANPWL